MVQRKRLEKEAVWLPLCHTDAHHAKNSIEDYDTRPGNISGTLSKEGFCDPRPAFAILHGPTSRTSTDY
jgi:hypothetical protein